MSGLHLVRMMIDRPALMRFAGGHGLLRVDDEGHGYLMHAWLAAMFGSGAPKPFRLFEETGEVLGYASVDAGVLRDHASAFAEPHAWEALRADSLASKPMPSTWRPGQRLALDVTTCPVSRKEGSEKDVFLRALDRLGDDAGTRADVYVDWFRRQWSDALELDQVSLTGMSRRRMLRKGSASGDAQGRPTRAVERPIARFQAIGRIGNADSFASMLARGIGRHRAFGFGMVLLRPTS